PRRTRLAAEAGGVCGVGDREAIAVDDLVPMEVRDRDLGGGDQIEPVLSHLIRVAVLHEFRILARPAHRVTMHEEWRRRLDVAVLPDVKVEHPVDERAAEAGTGAGERRKAASGHLRSGLERHQSKSLTQLPVRDRLKVEALLFAPLADEK